MIQVDGLTKYYGSHPAIRDLQFSINRGEVVGFLGLNGAGKTTMLKVLGCVLLPTSGRVLIDGYDVVADPHEIRKRIGFLPDLPPLYEEMTVSGYLSFVARLRGVAAGSVRSFVEEAQAKTALQGAASEAISTLSHGFRQRVGVAQALVHKPALLILDEPSNGLDPVQIVEMRSLIRNLRGEHTVLVSSHMLAEISQICDRLLVIQEGEIVAQGTEEDLARRLGGGGGVQMELRAPAARALEVLRAVPGVGEVAVTREDAGIVHLQVAGGAELRPQLARAAVQANLELLRLDRSEGRLENIFLKLTQGRGATA